MSNAQRDGSVPFYRQIERPGFYSKKQIVELTGLSPVTVWRLVKAGKFPPPVPLTPSGSRVGYAKSDVDDWCRKRAAGEAFA